MSAPQNGELLLVVLAVVRWGVGGAGKCADCHHQAEVRHTMEPAACHPSDRDMRFLQVTGSATTRATSRVVDEWMWSVMQAQLGYRPMPRKPVRPQKLCFTCASRRLEAYQTNGTGATAALVGTMSQALGAPRSYTAIFYAMRAGHDYQRIDKFLGCGVGNVSVRKLVGQGVTAWHRRYEPVSA